MSVFHKRETLLENITYMGLMAAINVIFVLLTYFVPFLLFALVFILPLSSAIVSFYCKKRYYIIYAVATIGICLLVTINDFADTLFFVIPSVVTGFLFGVLIKQKVPSIIVIAATTFAQILLTYPGLLLATKILYPNSDDIFLVLAKTIGIQDHPFLPYIKHLIIGAISLIQEVISFIVIKEESNRLGVNIDDSKWMDKLLPAASVIFFSAMSWIFIGILPEISYLFMLGSLLFAIYLVTNLVLLKKTWIYISLGCSFLVGIFVFAGAYTSMPEPLGFLNIQVIFCCVAIIAFINNYLLTDKKKS